MIRTAASDDRPLGAFYYDEDGIMSHLCDRCGAKITMNAQARTTHCKDCRDLERWDAGAPMRGLILDMLAEGMSHTAIADELGIHRRAIGRAVGAERAAS